MKSNRAWTQSELRTLLRQQQESGEVDEAVMDCSLEELQEFLEADLVDVPVNHEFKEDLRARLWDLVRTRNRSRGPSDAN